MGGWGLLQRTASSLSVMSPQELLASPAVCTCSTASPGSLTRKYLTKPAQNQDPLLLPLNCSPLCRSQRHLYPPRSQQDNPNLSVTPSSLPTSPPSKKFQRSPSPTQRCLKHTPCQTRVKQCPKARGETECGVLGGWQSKTRRWVVGKLGSELGRVVLNPVICAGIQWRDEGIRPKLAMSQLRAA